MPYRNDYLHDKYKSDSPRRKKTTRVHAKISKQSAKKPHYTLRNWIVGGVVFFGLILVLFWQPISDTMTVNFSSAPSGIKAAGYDAGLNKHGEAILLRNNPEFVDADVLESKCPHDQEIVEFGCYLGSSNKIYVLQIDDEELKPIELTAVAHETLHAVWNSLSPSDRQTLVSQLTSFYDSKASSVLTSDAEPYKGEDSTRAFVDELHSLAGSEVDSSEMPALLGSHFDKYFSDREKSVNSNVAFNQNIDDQIASLKSRAKQLDADSQNLNNYKSAHLDHILYYMRQASYYGDVYTYNKNVDAYNNNLKIYKNMVTNYNNEVDSYNSTRQKFVNAYSALFPTKSIPVGGAK